jgi:hypothetical protein
VESDPTRLCELLVGLPAVNVLGVDDERDEAVVVHIESRAERPECPACGSVAWVKDRPAVELVDLECFGRSAGLVWHKHRWCCPELDCEMRSWTAEDPDRPVLEARRGPAAGTERDRGPPGPQG